jgi:hypothetical protein
MTAVKFYSHFGFLKELEIDKKLTIVCFTQYMVKFYMPDNHFNIYYFSTLSCIVLKLILCLHPNSKTKKKPKY